MASRVSAIVQAMLRRTPETPARLSGAIQTLSGLLSGASDDENLGTSPPSFAAKGAPDAHLDFHFPEHPVLDHHFIFDGERAYVRPMARHDSATIHTSWQAYVEFFSGAATSQQLFIDG